ncbi:MAG: DUF393 domain-containing protein [Alphaproteobacteria bacterium]|nr:DUF393 domain-containing protein [Alphaproteobacteria bacterium]
MGAQLTPRPGPTEDLPSAADRPAPAWTPDPALLAGPILLFDGVCHLCRASVQFVLARDPRGAFRFASLQSDLGSRLAGHFGIPASELTSMVLVLDGAAHTRSAAALRTARLLRAPWPLLSVFLLVPAVIRNGVYDFIGRRRYRWFGKMDACWVPDAEIRDRFLD